MRFRILSLFLIILVGTSCEFFNLNKRSQLQEVDTIINFSSVDASPTFEACKDFIDKEAKRNCFRNTIYTHISKSLAKHTFEVRKPIDEVIKVDVIINSKGNTTVLRIISSDLIKESFRSLDSFVEVSVANLPKLFPATKRGIPVTTQYQIPIQITVN
jgi:hypothetical protein